MSGLEGRTEANSTNLQGEDQYEVEKEPYAAIILRIAKSRLQEHSTSQNSANQVKAGVNLTRSTEYPRLVIFRENAVSKERTLIEAPDIGVEIEESELDHTAAQLITILANDDETETEVFFDKNNDGVLLSIRLAE